MHVNLVHGAATDRGDAANPAWWGRLSSRLHNLAESVSRRLELLVDDSLPAFLRRDYQSEPADVPGAGATGRKVSYASERETKHCLLLSSTAAGLALAGTFAFPPLRAACLPVLVYLGVTPARQAYDELHDQHRIGAGAAQTIVLALCIVQGYYLAGSVAFSIYYLGQWAADSRYKLGQHATAPQRLVRSRRIGADYAVLKLVSDLCDGDIIIVEAGEMIPVSGVIVDGTALVKICKPQTHLPFRGLPQQQEIATVTNGHRVEADTIVQLGCVHITVAVGQA